MLFVNFYKVFAASFAEYRQIRLIIDMKYRYGQRSFWCRGYYVDTVGKNAKRIAEYVRNQLNEDMIYDQISIKEYQEPFNG